MMEDTRNASNSGVVSMPTEDQWKMILSDHPASSVIAGAGSGKSTTLVLRVVFYGLLSEDRHQGNKGYFFYPRIMRRIAGKNPKSLVVSDVEGEECHQGRRYGEHLERIGQDFPCLSSLSSKEAI